MNIEPSEKLTLRWFCLSRTRLAVAVEEASLRYTNPFMILIRWANE